MVYLGCLVLADWLFWFSSDGFASLGSLEGCGVELHSVVSSPEGNIVGSCSTLDWDWGDTKAPVIVAFCACTVCIMPDAHYSFGPTNKPSGSHKIGSIISWQVMLWRLRRFSLFHRWSALSSGLIGCRLKCCSALPGHHGYSNYLPHQRSGLSQRKDVSIPVCMDPILERMCYHVFTKAQWSSTPMPTTSIQNTSSNFYIDINHWIILT